jgi:hypothetical protein
MRIESGNGNFVIGTTDTSTYRLNVSGVVSGAFYVGGNVDIGTTSPARILQVGTGGRLGIVNSSSSFTVIGTTEDSSIPSTRIVLHGYNYNNGTSNGNIIYITTNNGYDVFISQSGVDTTQVERMRIVNTGNVGIGNTTPLGTLHLGDVSQANNDGRIIFAKCTTIGSTRICRVGYNNSFEFVIGDTGRGNALTTWIEQFKILYTSSTNSLLINHNAYVGMGVSPAHRTQIKLSYDDVATGLHLDVSDDSNPNKYGLTIWVFIIGGGQVGYRFRT